MDFMQSDKRIFIGLWILAVFLLLGYNGLMLSSLMNPQLLPRPQSIKLASSQWDRFERTEARRASQALDPSTADHITSQFTLRQRAYRAMARSNQTTKALDFARQALAVAILQPPPPPPVKLDVEPPSLTGVIRIADDNGRFSSLALMEGLQLKEGDVVRGFRVERITIDGVRLSYAGASRFVPAPKIYFSLDRQGSF